MVTPSRFASRSLAALGLAAALAAPASGLVSARQTEMQRVQQFENDRAVSWLSVIPPHTSSALHRHDRYRSVIAIVGGDLKTVTASGETTVTHYETGKAYWQAPMPPGVLHKDVNDTDQTIQLVVVEIKEVK
jgi:uncharacterized RmlC-like cupin family protein